MKLLVFAHRLELGGTQINAIELAAELRDRHGFDIIVHAAEGAAMPLLREKGLRFAPAPDVRLHPSAARMRALRELVRQEKPDLIHAWDWWQGLEAYCGVHLTYRVPLLISDMMMTLTRSLPRDIPTTFGFAGMKAHADRLGWRRTDVLLPPVDTRANAPDVVDGVAFRKEHGVQDSEIMLVSVSRLANFMKSEPLVRSIGVIRAIGRDLPVKLVIVGDGEARGQLQSLADAANGDLGREAIVLAGAMSDPRPAYAASDIVLGMGGSALRGMAFAKPLIVLGEAGFARLFSPCGSAAFHETGMYGLGDGSADNGALSTAITHLAQDEALRGKLGRFGRDYVLRHHSLDAVGDVLARVCNNAAAERPTFTTQAVDAARTAYFYMRERRFSVASRDMAAGR